MKQYYAIVIYLMGLSEYGLTDKERQYPEGTTFFDSEEEMEKFVVQARKDQEVAQDKMDAETEAEGLAGIPAPMYLSSLQTLFEYKEIWAEETSALKSNSSQFSYGNGATGFSGIPLDSGWEVQALYFHADKYPAKGAAQIHLMDYSQSASKEGEILATLALENAVDGAGSVDNAFKYMELPKAVPVETKEGYTVIGFKTGKIGGSISDVRVGVRLRRSLGNVMVYTENPAFEEVQGTTVAKK